MATKKIDLDQGYTVNGRRYDKGSDVEVDSDDVQAIEEMQKASGERSEWINAHHGAVPTPEDPQAPTAQTPTRPLGGPHIRVDEVVRPGGEQRNARGIKDPGVNEQASKETLREAGKNERTPEEDRQVVISGDVGDVSPDNSESNTNSNSTSKNNSGKGK